jgi:hypothetical protein
MLSPFDKNHGYAQGWFSFGNFLGEYSKEYFMKRMWRLDGRNKIILKTVTEILFKL